MFTKVGGAIMSTSTKKTYKSDLEIANSSPMLHIKDIANKLELNEEEYDMYGKYKAKIPLQVMKKLQSKQDGKLILVTAINPTSAGEGKSTVTVGLGDALTQLGKKAVIAMREPSLGPVMGIKGGACGGGYAQVLPMDDINLHFTGDIHAITTANNALASFIDNHIHQGNILGIDQRRIVWKRAVDLNDRALRNVIIGLGGPIQGVPREEHFDITVASEIMAILCLASDLNDLKARIARIVIGYTTEQKPVTVKDLGVEGALTLLLKDAVNPNLVQTIEHTPAIIHGGPFANIAHGCNSVIATKMALKLGDYVVTEAGFGADLGAEKFLHIKGRSANIKPDAVVIVATIRALKMHGGVDKKELSEENVSALKTGFANLQKHCENIASFGLPFVVSLNRFVTDSEAEMATFDQLCREHNINYALTEVWEKGGAGGIQLAEQVITVIKNNKQTFHYLYDVNDSVENKIKAIAQKVYGADDVDFSAQAKKQIVEITKNGWGDLPICMAKTQYSFSDNPTKLGRPSHFTITVRELKPSVGAGFIVALTGDVMTMPGLPKEPAALKMDVAKDGSAIGLF